MPQKPAFPAFVDEAMTPQEQQAVNFVDEPMTPVLPRGQMDPMRARLESTQTGIAKGALSTVAGLGKLVSSVPGVKNLIDKFYGEPGLSDRAFAWLDQELEATNPAEKVGKFAEQAAELAIPVGTSAKLGSWAPKGLKFGAKMVGEAAEFFGKTAAQTGGDEEAMITAALLGGASPVVGKVLEGTGKVVLSALPERLYGQILKSAEDDIAAAFKAEAAGGPANPTLAREILERGLLGSSRNMAVLSGKRLNSLEGQLQGVLKGQTMDFPQAQDYIKLLKNIAREFGQSFSKMGTEAKALAARLPQKGQIAATDALALKRLLDRARNTSSFRDSARLGPKQEEYKGAADLMRARLHETFPDASTLLNEERIYIQAFDAIVKDATQRKNRRLLGLTDYILGGGGMASGFGVSGIGAAAAVRGFQNPFTLSGLGQTLYRLGLVSPKGTTLAKTGAVAATVGTR